MFGFLDFIAVLNLDDTMFLLSKYIHGMFPSSAWKRQEVPIAYVLLAPLNEHNLI